jgi:hypothetical protein
VDVLTNAPYQVSVEAWKAGRLRNNALERFGIAADRMSEFQPTDADSAVDYALETLDLTSGQATGGTPTQWSIVFDAENLRVHWRTSRHAATRTVDFSRLDLGCRTPVEMLDVHDPLSGDVSDRMGTYSFDANLEHTLRFLEKWQHMELSALEVEVLLRGLDSFPCERRAPPYQEETKPVLAPLVGWIGRALMHRLWPAMVLVVVATAGLVVWRLRGWAEGE